MRQKLRAALCLALCVVMLIPVCACGSSGGYRVIDDYSGESSYHIAFRKGDRLKDYVSAAMEVLATSSVLRASSVRWFGEDLIAVDADADAMDPYWDSVPARTVIVGIDLNNMPLSYLSNAGYEGFDVELILQICDYLSWDVSFYPIAMENAEIELNAGNIDIAMAVQDSAVTNNMDVSPAYLTSRYVLVARYGSHIRRRSGLKGKTLGVTVADEKVLYQNEKFVQSLGSVIYQTNTEGLFQALMKGEVDGVLSSSIVAAYYMK